MNLLETIIFRHSVRRYKSIPISEEVVSALEKKITEINIDGCLHIQLILNEPKGFKSILNYGTFSGVNNYFIIAGQNTEDLDEKAGYYGEQLVLLAQQLGLNTCWAGLTYQKVNGTYTLNEGEKIVCYIALGYGVTQGTEKKHKPIKDISNASDLTPKWFNLGVEAARQAPTAVNQQKFYIEYLGMKGPNKKPKVSINSTFSLIGYTKIDLGIVRLHFEIGAGTNNFEWI